jgi:hypothetical protein
MNDKMICSYEVLNPWAEVDPIPVRGITPRVGNLAGKKIGLLANQKHAANPILSVVEKELRRRFPDSTITRYAAQRIPQHEAETKKAYQEWAKGVDAVVAAVGD